MIPWPFLGYTRSPGTARKVRDAALCSYCILTVPGILNAASRRIPFPFCFDPDAFASYIYELFIYEVGHSKKSVVQGMVILMV
jgi:hypothetical protein